MAAGRTQVGTDLVLFSSEDVVKGDVAGAVGLGRRSTDAGVRADGAVCLCYKVCWDI